ncbi:hypothetical protein BGX28_001534, partial [Mortierella sp. GBA30]
MGHTDGLKVHALGHDVSRRWLNQNIFKDVKKEFPDQSAVEAKLSNNWTNTTFVGIDIGEVNPAAFCGRDPPEPNTTRNILIRRSAL